METKSSLNNVCRTCLSSNDIDMYPLLENSYYNDMSLAEMLFTCCAIKTYDNSYKFICVECKTQLISFYKFRKQCEDSDAVLNTCVKNDVSPVFIKDIPYDVPKVLQIKEEDVSDDQTVDDNTDNIEPESLTEAYESDVDVEVPPKRSQNRIKVKNSCTSNSYEVAKPGYECTICSEKFYKLSHLEHHVSIHDSETPYICKECGKCFRKYKNLTVHQRVHTGQKPYLCTVCGKSFALSGNLKAHLRIHSGIKPYSCQECGKSFTQWSSLRSHLVCHSGERSYVCAICGKTFTRAGILSRHMTSHSDEKKYPCNLCNKRFKNSSQRARHLIIHTDEKKYKCTFCGKAFNRSSNLNVHLKIHTGVRPHACPVCGKGFIQLHCLRSHMNTHC